MLTRQREYIAAALTRPHPLRRHLIVLVIGVVSPLLAFGAFAIWRIASAERSHYAVQLHHSAKDLADDVDRAIEGMIVTLRTLATSTHLNNGDYQRFHDQAAAALAGSPFGLILIDPSLQLLVNTLVPYGVPLSRSADADTPARVLNSRQSEVSNLFIGAMLKRPFLNVDVPVIVKGEVRYILLLTFEPSYIQQTLLGQNLPTGWISEVSDAHGRVIARSADHERHLNTQLPEQVHQRRDDQSVFEAKTLDGVTVLRAVARLKHADWTAAATVPLPVVNAASRNAFWTIGFFGVASLALSIAAAAGLGRLLAGSILQLEAASRAIKAGSPFVVQPTALAEAASVQTALHEAYQARISIEEELRLTGQRLALAARIAGVAHATIDYQEDGKSIVDVSHELASLLGLPAAGPLAGDIAWAIIHPDEREAITEQFGAAISSNGNGEFSAEHRILKPDGTVAWLNVRSTTLFRGVGPNRSPRQTMVAVRDVTSRKVVDETLRASEARYRAALLVGRIASWETNLVTRQRLWSPEGKILFGLTLPGLIGRVGGDDDEYRNALHPDDRHLMGHFHRLAEATDTFVAEYRIRHADGTLLWVSGRGQVIERDRNGRPVRMISVVADITERRLAENALKMSEERFRMLAEAIPNIAWTANPKGELDWHSPRWMEYTGVTAQLPTAQGWRESIHANDLAKTIESWHAAVSDSQPYEVEHRLLGKDGKYRWFLSRAIPVPDKANDVVAWVGTATNIHALKSIEADLARYVAVANAAHDGLISITLEGIIENWNIGAVRLFGYEAAEVIGRSTAILIPNDALSAHRTMIDTVRRGGTVGPVDVKRRHKDGRLVDVAISMTTVRDGHGTAIAIAKVAHDVAGRIHAEQRQQLLNRELVHRVKNSFAVLQSVMRATLRSCSSLKEFEEIFSGRIQSMAVAQDLLTEREWRDAEISDLARRQLAPHIDAGRITIDGPSFTLPSECAVPLGLLLHELATNAVKYGALSASQGHVSLCWSTKLEGIETTVEIFWREQGGPPVTKPERRGFGSVLIEKGLPTAKVTREFHAEGATCKIVISVQTERVTTLHESAQ
jgi:PAS domain S-box-containing protein